MVLTSTLLSTGTLLDGVYGLSQALSGVRLYSAWMAFTAAKSSGPFACVCPRIQAYLVGERKVCLISDGAAPFQFGPAIRKLPGPVPVVRLPAEPKTSVHMFIIENT